MLHPIFMIRSLILIFTALTFSVTAQQDPLITKFWNHYAAFNPGSSGLEHIHHGAITYREQWDGVIGAPNSIHANYGTLLGKYHGVGIIYSNQNIGHSNIHSAKLNYNFQLDFDRGRRLSLGVSPGFQTIKSEGIWIPPTTEDDPSLPDLSSRSNAFTSDLGVAYSGRVIFGGIGITNLLSVQNPSNSFSFARHYYLHYRQKLQFFRQLYFHLEGVFRTDIVKASFDLNARAILYDKITLGVGYRYNESFIFHAGWDIKKRYRVAYSFDYTTYINPLSSVINKGSHEITLGFYIPHEKLKIKSTGIDF
jgi:type IX secretion system PorP/SprF family membrane protein